MSAAETDGSDVQLVVGDAKFYAHRSILSSYSPVFHAMFNGEYSEKRALEVPVIVDGIEARHVEAFLQCLYACGCPPY
ncbi:BTB and MATH domain-containing protein 38, partial [Aphelenchoides avenae]